MSSGPLTYGSEKGMMIPMNLFQNRLLKGAFFLFVGLSVVTSGWSETKPQTAAARLKDKDPLVRRLAVQELAQARDIKNTSLFMNVLDDSDPAVRSGAVEGLAAVRAPEAVRRIADILLKDKSEEVRQSAAINLAQFGDPSVTPALLQALNDPFDGVRLAAAQTLGRMKIQSAVTPLTEKMKDPDPRMRRTVVYALKNIKDGASGPVRAALKDSDAGVRQQAALALGEWGDKDASSSLKEALNDKDAKVKVSAALALGRLGDPSGFPQALAGAQSAEPETRALAARALGETKNPQAIPILEKLQNDSDAFVQREANNALLRLGVKPKPKSKP